MRIILCILLLVSNTWAQEENEKRESNEPSGYSRRLTVFPFSVPAAHTLAADKAWWKVREELTDTKRFLVASKRFLTQKDVFQPRTRLAPPDAILLGQLLEANGLIVTKLENRKLSMTLYSGFDGFIMWQEELELHSSLPIDSQIEDISLKLIRDLISRVPYHATTLLDPIVGKTVFDEGDLKLAKVDAGDNTRTQPGEVVQWIELQRKNSEPLFQSGGELNVIAEGEVLKNENGVLLVEIKRARDIQLIQTKTLVRLPREADFLASHFAVKTKLKSDIPLQYAPMPPTRPEADESRPLYTALAIIANVLAFLLLGL